MSEQRAPYNLALLRDALGQGGIDEGLKLSKGLRVGSIEVPAGQGDLWLENSIRYSTCLSAGASNGVVSLPSSVNWTPVPMDTEVWDTDEILDISTSATQMVIKTAGVYSIYGYVTFGAHDTGSRGIGIMVNGVTLLGAEFMLPLTGKTYKTINVTWLLDEDDYVELVIYQNSTGELDIEYPLFSVARVP